MRRAALCVLLFSLAAHAGFDKIRLKSGAVLTGTIIDGAPGQTMRIRLLTGRVQVVEPAEVAKLEMGHALVNPPKPPPPTVAAPVLKLPARVRDPDAPPAPPEAPPAEEGPAGPAGSVQAPKKPMNAVVKLNGDGGTMKGALVDFQAGKTVTLRLSSGRTFTFSDDEVSHVELQPAEPPPPPAPEPLPAPPLLTAPDIIPLPPVPLRADAKADRRAPEVDTLFLADGDVVRGKILQSKPTLMVQLANGATRSYPAAEVRLVEPRGNFTDGLDAVWLKDGTVVRGAVSQDKDGATVKLLSGRLRTVPQAEIDRVVRRQ